jgi:carbon-monoxide dehydrogenase medium subunit
MKAAPFDYAAPERVEDALRLLTEHGAEARVLAGGQSLIPMLAMRLARFDLLVDITRIPALRGVTHDGDRLRIGATTLQAIALEDPVIAREVPLLAEATTHVGHFQTRNRGTIGGALAHADPTAEYPAVAQALGVEFEVAGANGTRTLMAETLYESAWVTTLAEDELIVASRWPRRRAGDGSALVEVARRRGDFALLGAAAAVHVRDGTIVTGRVVMFGVGDRPRTVLELTGAAASLDELDRLAADAAAALDPPDDVHASADYRRRVAPSVIVSCVRRAVQRALQEAR